MSTDSTPEDRSRSDAYRVRAGSFEGPLDLLLHLVRINEVNIADIPILEITRQYNEYLDLMRELNLDVAGEYLVLAATLMHIKSRMLLPADPAQGEEGAEDPRQELVEQLVEYQRYKQAAETLHAIDAARTLVWTRDGVPPGEFAGEELLVVELFDLIAAFRSVLGRLDEEVHLRLRRDDVSVAEKIGWLTDLLEERPSVDLFELFVTLPRRIERIATFLAVLEMLRLRLIVVFQRKRLGAIRVALRVEPHPGSALERGASGSGQGSKTSLEGEPS